MNFINFLKNIIHKMLQLLSFGRKSITNSLSIYVKSNTGNTLFVDVNPNWDIKNVKEIVAPQLGLQPDEVKIIFAGKELGDNIIISECDIGQQSTLHAVRTNRNKSAAVTKIILEENILEESIEDSTKPLSQTLIDLQIEANDRENISENDREKSKAHFFIYCTQCNELCPGKLRVRCSICKGGAFTVHRDPECWDDVLVRQKIRGHCESSEIACLDDDDELPFAEFYFKCAKHTSQGEKDYAAPLNLIKRNIKDIPCLACSDIVDPCLVFSCSAGHVTCLDCFRNYCSSRLLDRQFIFHPEIGYTLSCPVGCENSFIQEIHHFKLLTRNQYENYQRFATEEFVLQSGGVLCPQPDCGMGLLVEPECTKVTCEQGCGYVFCRKCLQGYHLGDCLVDNSNNTDTATCEYTINAERVADARWDEASKITIRVSTKPCPKCRTPTERDGGCMHMLCTRAGCGLEWCWVCQTNWSRDCMGAHWFG